MQGNQGQPGPEWEGDPNRPPRQTPPRQEPGRRAVPYDSQRDLRYQAYEERRPSRYDARQRQLDYQPPYPENSYEHPANQRSVPPNRANQVNPDARKRPYSLGPARAVWISAGLGLCVDGIAVSISATSGFGETLFWIALLVPFCVQAMALCAANLSTRVRQLTLAIIGLYPAIVYRMSSPIVLGGFDEHLHERTLLDLLHGGGLFAPNPQLQVGPYYPGLELFTGVATRLTGVPTMLSMLLVVFLCRLLFVLALYQCALSVLRSERSASLVVMFYAASPQFYFFNSQFAYQTMALTLGMGGIYFLRRAQFTSGRAARLMSGLAMLELVATVVSHHLTSWLFLAFLLAWAAVCRRHERKIVLRAALVMVISVGIWSAAIASQLAGYLGPVFSAAFDELKSTAAGTSKAHTFNSSGGATSPEWEKLLLIFYALCGTCAALICGGILIRRAIRMRNPRIGLLALLTIAYPATLAAHFVPAASDVGDRSSTFFFLPFALSCALVVTTARRPRWLGADKPRAARLIPLMLGLSIVYIGGVALGAGPGWGLLPGPYLVSAEARTQDPYTLAAVRWAAGHIPAGSRIVADRIPSDLLASQARLWPISAPTGDLEPALLYFSTTWGRYQTDVVKGLSIRYIYVDRRLSDSLPLVGNYFYPGETGNSGANAAQQRISKADISKFSHVAGLNVVYHLGPVTIYGTSGLGVTNQRDGFTGVRSMGLGAVGDYLLGALAVALIFVLRRRLRWLPYIARNVGALGTTVALIAILIMMGGVLFESRFIPGPYFSLGAITVAALIAIAVLRKRRIEGVPIGISMPFMRHLDAAVIFGALAAMAGIALAIHSMWHVDVTQVNDLLRMVQK